eukprot:2587443-Amphidinium_carterae.1
MKASSLGPSLPELHSQCRSMQVSSSVQRTADDICILWHYLGDLHISGPSSMLVQAHAVSRTYGPNTK